MTLFHFSSGFHWPAIEASGVIRPSEPNIRPEGGGAPTVVWLLDSAMVDQDAHGLYGKGHIVIEVECPSAIKWTDWEWTGRMDPAWRKALLSSSGGEEAAERWWLVPGEVPSSDWVRAWLVETGEPVWPLEQA